MKRMIHLQETIAKLQKGDHIGSQNAYFNPKNFLKMMHVPFD